MSINHLLNHMPNNCWDFNPIFREKEIHSPSHRSFSLSNKRNARIQAASPLASFGTTIVALAGHRTLQ